jgi:predicted ATP-dependent endonuclease of OLD family
LNEINEAFPEIKLGQSLKLPKRSTIKSFLELKSNEIFNDSSENIFIPSGRLILSILSNQTTVIDSKNLEYTVREFIEYINDAKFLFSSLFDQAVEGNKLANELSEKILKGKYLYETGNERIFMNSEKSNKLTYSSSGQQEAVYLIYLLKHLLNHTNEPYFLTIEEPEAHLYPEAQQQIINLIALFANQNQNQVILTTHSPYILSAVNNLTYAHKVGKTHPDKASEIIPRALWLDFKRVYCGFVENGRIRDIMDDEFEMIKNEEIDNASRLMNREFDALYELKFAENEL